jgi:hypothetical protein
MRALPANTVIEDLTMDCRVSPYRHSLVQAARWLALILVLGSFFSPVAAHGQDPKPKLLIQATAEDKHGLQLLHLRPNGALEQAFYVMVDNPTIDDKEFVVKMRAGKQGPELIPPVTFTVKAKQKAAVPFGKKPTTTGTTANEVKPAEAKPADAKPVAHTLPDGPDCGLSFELEWKGGANPKEERVVPVRILNPTQYVEYADARYDEAANQLSVRVRASSQFSGPECPVRLVLSPERIPNFLSTSGTSNLSGKLKASGDEQTLVARGLKFKDTPHGKGYATVTVDGYERAFILELTLGQVGVSTPRLLGGSETIVRLDAEPYIKPAEKYPVRVEVDNPPTDDVTIELGLDRQGNGEYDITRFEGPRERKVQVMTEAQGRLVFKVETHDRRTQLDIADMTGKHGLRVQLRNEGRLVDFFGPDHLERTEKLEKKVTITDASPKDIKLNANYSGGKILVVASAHDDTEITGAKFFIGDPLVDDKGVKKAPPGAKEGKLKNKSMWQADLEPKAGVTGPVQVGVELTNAVKATAIETTTVVVPLPGTGDTKTGTIKVKVTENDIPQRTLEVVLLDAKGAEKDKKDKAGDDGSYLFEDVPPGTYKVSTYKSATMRGGSVQAKVEAGKTFEGEIMLKLMRKKP